MAKIIIKDSEISSSANIHFSGSITGESANFSSITNVTSINATTISGTTGQFGVLTASNGYVSDKLGVGTTSPNYTLSVTGTLGVSGNAVMSTITASNIQVDTITAREFYTQLVTSSVIYESGSTKFGDTQDDLHQFTGSVDITGSARTSNLIISQDAGSTVQPQIQFIGSASNPITLKVLDDNSLSFVNNGNNEVFHIDADLTGTIFSVTDGSGIPSIEVEDTGDITLAEFGGNVGVGTGSPSYKLDVSGTMRVTGASQFASVSGTLGQFNSLTVVNGSTTLAALSGTVGEFTTVSASIFTGSTGLLTALTASNVQITNLDVDTITAREYYTELVSSSIIYESGSTKFGDTSDDIHDFTGSVNIVSGNLMLGAPGENIDRTLTIHGSNTSNKLFYITQTIGGPVLGYSVANQNISFGTSVQPWQYINHYASTAHSFYIGSSEKVRIDSNGNVGIGTTSPGAKLDVNGTTNLRNDLTVTGSLLLSGSLHYVAGNVDISGTLSATAKSFDIEHPTKEGMRLVYGSLESPYHGVRLTGESCLTKGESKVFLPDYISSLCKQEDSSVQITNIKHGKVLWVEEINIEKNYFIIKADIEEHDNKLYNFFWSFTAIRKDIEDLVVEY